MLKKMFQPKLYAKTNFFNQNLVRKLLDEYSSKMDWQLNASLVDVGTGTGVSLVEEVLPYIPDFKKVVGIDFSQEMIDFAKEKYTNIPNLDFIFEDIQNEKKLMHFRDQFDYATSFSCLMTVPDQLKALKTIKSLVKPGGKCLFSVIVTAPIYDSFNKFSTEEKWKTCLKNMKQVTSPYYFLDEPVHEMEKYLEQAGFREFEITLREDTEFYEDKYDCMGFVRSLSSTSLIPKQRRDEFFDQVLEDFEHCGYIKNGGCEFTCKTLVVYAIK